MINKKNETNRIKEAKRKKKSHLKFVSRKNKFQSFNSVKLKEQRNEITKDNKIIALIKENTLSSIGYLITPGSGDTVIQIPKIFCFCTNYNDSIQAIKLFASSVYDYLGVDLTIDFSKCTKVDTAALFMLQIIRIEILEKISFIQNRLKFVNVMPVIKVTPPKSRDTVRLLLIAGFPISEHAIENLEDDSNLVPIHNMGYLKGSKSQRHYLENKKSVYTSQVVSYLNSCLKEHSYELTEIETNNIDGIIGEVLSNAEDHSGTNFWYITANFSKELLQSGSEVVGEMNLTIMNFGNSIYEAFLNTKNENTETFSLVDRYTKKMFTEFPNSKFSEEQLYMLATMQEQISRLKFERESRGTGTMKFINSFLQLGDFEDKNKGYVPNLSIFSGRAHLICDNTFKPFLKDNVYCLSLNPENDLLKLPHTSHLKVLSEKFPGTLLSVKIYINKEHWDTKYGGNNHEQN